MRLLTVLFAFALVVACGGPKAETPRAEVPADTAAPPPAFTFAADVQPIFTQNCGTCHGAEEPKASYVAVHHVGLLGGGEDDKPNIVAGQPDSSLTFQYLRDGKMPPSGKLADAQIETVRRWITDGAKLE
ncbi:MAG: c-type cytochrome domain-containing protein [bacterium]